jgi:hypothetical protein
MTRTHPKVLLVLLLFSLHFPCAGVLQERESAKAFELSPLEVDDIVW